MDSEHDVHSMGQPMSFGAPVSSNQKLESAFCSLQIEKMDLESKYKHMIAANEELKTKYDQAIIDLHKSNVDKDNLRYTVTSLDKKVLELREENEKLKSELQKCPKGSANGGN